MLQKDNDRSYATNQEIVKASDEMDITWLITFVVTTS